MFPGDSSQGMGIWQPSDRPSRKIARLVWSGIAAVMIVDGGLLTAVVVWLVR